MALALFFLFKIKLLGDRTEALIESLNDAVASGGMQKKDHAECRMKKPDFSVLIGVSNPRFIYALHH